MEKRLDYKKKQLEKAVHNFNVSLAIETKGMSHEVADTIKSGQVQKFEVVVDLMWKTLKIYLYELNGIVVNSPKMAVKEFFKVDDLSYKNYEWLIKMIDMRNQLSRIYDSEKFEQIHTQVKEASKIINQVIVKLNKDEIT